MTRRTRHASTAPAPRTPGRAEAAAECIGARMLRALLTQRIVLLAVLIVVVVVSFFIMDAGRLPDRRRTTSTTCRPSLINAVPLAMLGLGRTAGDPLRPRRHRPVGRRHRVARRHGLRLRLRRMGLAAVGGDPADRRCSARCAARSTDSWSPTSAFPALIATLATYYAFKSLAIVINNQQPISTAADPGAVLDQPVGRAAGHRRSTSRTSRWASSPSCCPTVVVVWLLLARTTYGRRLYAIGTNDVAARWSGLPVRDTRFKAYVYAGLISGLVAVVTVAQFASARPDAGVSGNGMALPAITIAVLGGVAITGGIGRVAGVVLATLLIVWLNAGILLAFVGNEGSQYQLLALGAVLVFAALLNGLTNRRYGGSPTPSAATLSIVWLPRIWRDSMSTAAHDLIARSNRLGADPPEHQLRRRKHVCEGYRD